AGLRNVDADLAMAVSRGLGMAELPEPVRPAREPNRELPASPALSIAKNGPDSFKGRRVGVLVTQDADAFALNAVRTAAAQQGVQVEIVAPAVAGVSMSDGTTVVADQKIDGAPSVLYDAVVVLASEQGATSLSHDPAARDFVTDAYAHFKFIGYTAPAVEFFKAAALNGLSDDDGIVDLDAVGAEDFLRRCVRLRHWDRSL
ncbi:MAG TPA: DJ-1/PfpI family protein, partial [Acidimicrobiales bacterium]|nr:DJ-1/PfpI family protein [Acidimicrobiales bacterium]